MLIPSQQVETELSQLAGARPWDRDKDDVRVLYFIAEGRGTIINDEKEVSHYPVVIPSFAVFREDDWDLNTMVPRALTAQTVPKQ